MLTEVAVLGARDAPTGITVFSCFELVLGLEKDLNISDDCLFAADRLLAGFSSVSLSPSIFVSRATAAFDSVKLSLEEDPTNGFKAFLSPSLMLWFLLLIFIFAETGGTPIDGRLPVLRYVPRCQD